MNELCDLQVATTLDGRSLVPLLKDPEANWPSSALTGLTSKGGPVWKPYISIRTEAGRYIRYQDGEEEFYDTTSDPHEWTNQITNPHFSQTIKGLRGTVPSLTDMATPLPNHVEASGKKK